MNSSVCVQRREGFNPSSGRPNSEKHQNPTTPSHKSRKLFSFIALLFLLLPALSHAQEPRWYDDFFLEASVHHYFAPEMLDGLIQPKTGFRGALGYEYSRFRFAVESGYTAIPGTDNSVIDVSLAPLVFKFGYALPIRWGFGLQADLGTGVVFSRATHYDSDPHWWLNWLTNNKRESKIRSPVVGARLYATYTIPQNFLKIYAGGGIDTLFETEGPIPLPLIEAGVSFKPVMLIRPWVAKKKAMPKERVIVPGELVFSDTPENLVIEESEHGRTVRLLNAVYFEANSVAMIERYRPILNEAGRRLHSDPNLRITLRAYSAPFGTTDGQVALSAARAWFCVEYFMRQYDIAEARMKIEYYGAQRSPEFADATWESYRCVELIIME
jgi:flagellar motor protein MotB